MTIKRYRDGNPRTADQIASAIEQELQAINSSAPVVLGTQNYAFIQSFATTIAEQQEAELLDLYNAGFITDASGIELTKHADEIGVERREATRATGVVQFSSDTAVTQDRVIPSGTQVSTGGNDSILFETTETATITNGTTTASANIVATDPGPSGNVGSDTITVIIDVPPGVDSVTNPNATGSPSFTLTDGTTPLVVGQARENDENLRERALNTTAIGGAGTAQSAELALENIDEVLSANVFTNRSDTASSGVDPWHTEVRIYGGNIDEIADTLYEVLPLSTLITLQGGANGTQESTTIDGGETYGTLTIPITRPDEITVTLDIDIVHDSTYAGTATVKDDIVEYIGGTKVDNSVVTGLAQDDDVLLNEVENVAEDVAGVDYADITLADMTGDSTDDSTTDADGVPVLSISSTEVAIVDADDITLSETAR